MKMALLSIVVGLGFVAVGTGWIYLIFYNRYGQMCVFGDKPTPSRICTTDLMSGAGYLIIFEIFLAVLLIILGIIAIGSLFIKSKRD